MKGNLKKRLAIFLSILFVLPAIVTMLPMNPLEVSAATTVSLSLSYNLQDTNTVQVEAGQGFYFGDYVSVSQVSKTKSTYNYASELKASYASSEKKVADIGSDGYVETKKAGKTKITVTYKKKKLTCTLEVVPAGTLTAENSAAVKKLETQAKNLSKKMTNQITTANGYNVIKALNAYDKAAKNEAVSKTVSVDGFLKEMTENAGYTYYKISNKLVVPLAGRKMVLENIAYAYGHDNNPTGTTTAKQLKISSVTANTSAITVKTTKKVDNVQILAAHIMNRSWNTSVSGKKATFTVAITDASTNKYYTGVGELNKGSNVIKITLKEYYYKNGKSGYKNVKLVKGHTYELGYSDDWAKGKKVTVK